MNARGLVLVALGVLILSQTLGGNLWARLNVTVNPG